MLRRMGKFLVGKFTNKLLNSVDIYKTINNNRETVDQRIHNVDQRIQNIELRLNHFPQDILKLFFNELRLNPDAIEFSKKITLLNMSRILVEYIHFIL